MLSTVDLELVNFVNPDLTWNRVTKGQRSASKRSRKPARSLDAGAQRDDESPKRSDESSVSESEKLGVAVLGRRFAEKVDHMPIKKRRLLLRSPSPPRQTPSPLHEEFPSPQPQTPSPHGDESTQCMESSEGSGQWRCSKSFPNQQLGAFDGSLFVQFSEGVDRVIMSGKLSEVTRGSCNDDFSGIALLAAAACNNSVENDADNVKEYPIVEGSLTPEAIDSSASAIPLKETVLSAETGIFSLNDSVGEENINGLIVRDNTVDKLQNHQNNKKDGELVKVSVCSKDERLHWDLNTVMDAWEEPCDTLKIDPQTNGTLGEKLDNLEDCKIDRDPEDSQHDEEIKAQSNCKMVSTDLLGNNMLADLIASDIGTSKSNREELLLEADSDAERTWFEEKIVSAPTEHGLEALHASANTKASALVVSTETSNDNSGKLSSAMHENLSALDAFRKEGQPVVSDDAKGENNKASTPDTTVFDSPPLVMLKSLGHEEIQGGSNSHDSCESYGKHPTCHSGKIDSGDPSEDCNVSGLSHDGRGRMVDSESMTEPRTGYDSPFEDGELRESVLYSWEENEAEWETECVDYESDKANGADESVAEKVEVEQCGRGDALKEPSHSASLKTKLSGWDQLPEGYKCPDRTGEVNYLNTRKIFTSDGMNGSKTSRGNLDSHTEGTSCSGVLHDKEAGYIQRSRSNNRDNSYARPRGDFGSIRSFGRGRSSMQIRNRSQENGHWVNSAEGYTDSRNHYPTGFHRYDTGDRMPRSHIANSTERDERPRQPINYSSKSIYRPFSRGRSPTDRDESYTVPARDISGGRGRGRSRVYPQGAFHPFAASRERSFSPIHSRGAHFSRPCRRSRSRSRSRSPRTWGLQRERNVGNRRHSRSPDFVSGPRMKRMNTSSFAADEGERFMSPPRGRFFSQCNSRWIGERNCVADRFRERRSPVRIFRQNQRPDAVGSPGRVKSDNYLRPVMRPGGRHTDIRKNSDDHEMIRRVRHYNDEGVVRRFCYDAEDNFDSRNSRNEGDYIRSSDRRNVYRSDKEASGGPFRYNNSNRMYSTGPKSSGIQDFDDDASPRRG